MQEEKACREDCRRQIRIGSLIALTLVFVQLPSLASEESVNSRENAVKEFKSASFVLHTDVDETQARAALARMESTLRIGASYWGRRLKGQIECYLVDDLANWPMDAFPEDKARVVLELIGGGTVVDSKQLKTRFVPQSSIYATTKPGVVEHEVIHAYCFQTFGRGGPDWYREGMAELFAMNSKSETGAKCRKRILSVLSDGKPLSLKRILARKDFTDSISQMIGRNPSRVDIGFDLSTEKWDAENSDRLKSTRIAYAECWALCYLLHHNPNYEQRFRMLGRRFMSDKEAKFEDLFRPMMQNIDFELRQLGHNMGDGYRADLCRWNWSTAFDSVEVGKSVSIDLKACAGYQSSRLSVKSGEEYQVTAVGKWLVARDESRVDADGDEAGQGQLEAVVLESFKLKTPQVLGSASTLRTVDDGQLYLRCHDNWLDLEDNRGAMQVRLKRIK